MIRIIVGALSAVLIPTLATPAALDPHAPDNTAADFQGIDSGGAFSAPKLLPDLAKTNYARLSKLDCPVIIFAGRYDYTTPTAPVRSWFDALKSRSKRWVWFENSAHMMYGEEPGRVLVHLVQDARPFAEKAGDVAPEAASGAR